MQVTTVRAEQLPEASRRILDATKEGPVFIVENARHAYVLQTIADYYRNGGPKPSIVDFLADPDSAHIEFDSPRFVGPAEPPFEFD